MNDLQRLSQGNGTDKISCLDDVPDAARRGQRQQFLNKWYRPAALAPFVIVLIIDFNFVRNPNNWIIVSFGLASLFWAVAIAGYAFYLLVSLRCPKCNGRFGLGNNCRSCGLPRHSDSFQLLDMSD
jgi:hypothetical protein